MSQKFYNNILAIFFVMSVSACSMMNDSDKSTFVKKSDDVNLNNADGVRLNKPLIIPPGLDKKSIQKENISEQVISDNLLSLSPKGLNIETLFAEKLDDDERFDRLEQAFIDFRKEYEKIAPAILRLSAVESDINNLINELESFVDVEKGSVEFQQEGVIVEEIAPKDAIQDPQNDINKTEVKKSNVLLNDIRIGQHPNKLRIVFDLDRKAKYDVMLNNEKKKLSFSLYEASLSPSFEKNKSKFKNGFLNGFEYKKGDNEPLNITFPLTQDTVILSQSHIPPKNGVGIYKIVIDLKN